MDETNRPISSRIGAQQPQFMAGGTDEVAITYFASSSTPRVFKSKDSLQSFLVELETIGRGPITFSEPGGHRVEMAADELADWMTDESRGFNTFHLAVNGFSLNTFEGDSYRRQGQFYVNGTIRFPTGTSEKEFRFPQLVSVLENATRPATRKELKAKPYPYVTYQSREAIDATKSDRKNLIAVAVVSVVGTFVATVLLGVLTNVLHF